MEDILYIEINCFAIIIIAALLFGYKKNKANIFLKELPLFEYMLYTNILILVFDSITCLLEGRLFVGATVLNIVFSSAFYMMTPLLGTFFLLYCLIKIDIPLRQYRIKKWIYLIPFLINIILVIVNIFFPLIFSLNNNVYKRESYFWLSLILCYLPIAIAVVEIIYNMKKFNISDKREHLLLLSFIVPPLIGGVIQLFSHRLSIVWISTIISLIIMFITIQNYQIFTDTLTGLFNRRQLLPYLKWSIQKKRKNSKLFLILLDIDDFKNINDTYGHLEGDKALKMLASGIKMTCDKSDFVARYGGDEFVIVAMRQDKDDIDILLRAIDFCIVKDSKKRAPYTLTLTAGYAEHYDDMDADALISTADKNMYVLKTVRKNQEDDTSGTIQ